MSEIHIAQALLSKHRYALWASRYSPRYLAFTAIVFALAAVLIFSTAIFGLMKSRELSALSHDGVKAQARIIALEVRKHWQKKSFHETTVTYTFVDRDGGEHKGSAYRSFRAPPAFRNGELIEVLYDPADPESSTILTGLSELVESNKNTFGVGLFGTALLLICLARYVQWRRQGSPEAST